MAALTRPFLLPAFLNDADVTNTMRIGSLSAIPYGIAVPALIMCGHSSDYYYERRWHIKLLTLIRALALGAFAIASGHLMWALANITFATACILAAQAVLLTIVSDYLKGNAAAGASRWSTALLYCSVVF
jgi:hypothetical protein